MNKSFKLAKLVAKTCCWKWEVNPGHFAVLPMRVASKLEVNEVYFPVCDFGVYEYFFTV